MCVCRVSLRVCVYVCVCVCVSAVAYPEYSMYNRDVSAIYVEHYNLSCSKGSLAHVQEQDVSSVETWLHGP